MHPPALEALESPPRWSSGGALAGSGDLGQGGRLRAESPYPYRVGAAHEVGAVLEGGEAVVNGALARLGRILLDLFNNNNNKNETGGWWW